ncbi:MAG: sulfotransferase family protein, partial [Nocardioidaceae bacterium]
MTRHLLVIGAQRCGTTYLQALLDAHPDITMARPSRPEPKYFLSAEAGEHGLDEYRTRYFSHAAGEALLGEKSTSYIEHPEAAGRATEVLGRAAIVVMLRDPVDRAVSNWRFSVVNGLEDRPLEEALAENLESTQTWDPETTSVSPYAYLERGRYDGYLDSWYAAFPGTTHVRFYEDLTRDEHAIG